MKKKMAKLLSLALSLVLALSLTLPTLAYEDTDPPQWEQYGYSSLEEMPADWEMSEDEYYESIVADMLEFEQYRKEEEAKRQAWLETHQAEVSAFDPYAYFAQEYPYYDSPEEYMEWSDLTEEEFRQEMLYDWVSSLQLEEADRVQMAQEKEAVGGSADGINVMVNGQCIPFPDVRPEIQNDRTMVPLAAAMEFLGAQVTYDQAGHSTSVTLEGRSFTHAIGTSVLVPPEGDPITMDVASYVKDGRTMVPVAFFAQYLSYEVYWDAEYQTAVLLDRQLAVDTIDENFTLVNRILYTLSGGAVWKEGQSLKSTLDMDLVITMLDSLHGEKTYSMSLTGNELTNSTTSQIKYTANLADLLDLIVDQSSYLIEEEVTELEAYRPILAKVDLEIIVDIGGQCLYFRSPILAQLDLVEDPKAWAALPLNGLMGAGDLAPAELTVGQLLIAVGFADPGSPFMAWSYATNPAAELMNYVGDDCFTKSGSSYLIQWDMTDLAPYGAGSDESFTAALKVTPSGAKSCTYSLTMETGDRNMALELKLAGSSGKASLGMALHIKNTLKAVLDLDARISTANQQPMTQPPEGEKIEYPAGMLGSLPLN